MFSLFFSFRILSGPFLSSLILSSQWLSYEPLTGKNKAGSVLSGITPGAEPGKPFHWIPTRMLIQYPTRSVLL